MYAYLKYISYYLPEKELTNEQLAQEFPEWTVEKIASKIGVRVRHIAAENQTAADMGVKATEKLFAEYAIDRTQIDFLLFCTQSPDYFLPTSACVMQSRLGLPTSCGAMDFNLGCSGFVYGLAMAKGLIAGNMAKNVLLITSETYSKLMHPKDKGNRTIFGDAAAAALISTDGFAQIGDFSFGTDGTGADNLIVKTGAFRNRNPKNDLKFDENNYPKSSDYLFMHGGNIFHFTSHAVPAMVEDVLRKNAVSQKDIDLFVFHQANKFMINFLRKQLNIEKEKFYIYMENVGNTVSSTIPIALYHAQKEGVVKGNILLAGFGVGYSWGATILKIISQ